MRYRHYHWWKLHFYLPLLLAGALLTLLACAFVYHYTAEEMKHHVAYMGESKMAGLAENLERYVSISQSQSHFVIRENGRVDAHRYLAQAKTLFDMGDALVYMGLAPGGEVAYEFPINYIQPENRHLYTSAHAEQAFWARDMHTSVSFFQKIPGKTGTEMVDFRPIYVMNGTGTEFWGYSIILVDEKKLMDECRMSYLAEAGLYYRLTRRDGISGGTYEVDSNGPVPADGITSSRLINSHLWTLTVAPVHGFADRRLVGAILWAGLLTTLVLSYLAESTRRGRLEGRRDPLTGLYNRKGGDEAVAAYMEAHPRTRAAVLFMDIDNFKIINDVYGHEAGDRALIQFGRDIRSIFGGEAIITRNGGDEFVVYLPYEAEDVLFHQMDTFCHEPHLVEDRKGTIRFTSSLGCALYPRHGNNYSQLCIQADFALYSAKLNGKAAWHLYDPAETRPVQRTQFGFNISDIASGMPGALLVYRAADPHQILFANRKMVDLYGCSTYEELQAYLQDNGRHMTAPEDRDRVEKEIRQKETGPNAGKPGFITYHIRTRTGKTLEMDTIGTLSRSSLYGDVYYVFLYPHGLGK